jgi:3-methyladenine DNA glycosylase AlkC
MADLLKNELNLDYLKSIQKEIAIVDSSSSADLFYSRSSSGWDNLWDNLELKDRYQNVAHALGDSLSGSYLEKLEKVVEIGAKYDRLKAFAFPQFVAFYGLDDYDESMKALAELTQYSTSEFAIRPFIEKNPEAAFERIKKWRISDNEHIRRLSSEGIRPFLPWAQRIDYLTKNPKLILDTIDQLKKDDSLYVRTSIANTINDLSKIDVELVSEYLKLNINKNEYTDWILKKGMRTLLKEGNSTVLNTFGYDSKGVNVSELELDKDIVSSGQKINFSFTVDGAIDSKRKTRVEYHMYFMKKNGKKNKKVFQIFDGYLAPKESKKIEKNYKFQDLSTRKHYEGEHDIIVTLNGVEVSSRSFQYKA